MVSLQSRPCFLLSLVGALPVTPLLFPCWLHEVPAQSEPPGARGESGENCLWCEGWCRRCMRMQCMQALQNALTPHPHPAGYQRKPLADDISDAVCSLLVHASRAVSVACLPDGVVHSDQHRQGSPLAQRTLQYIIYMTLYQAGGAQSLQSHRLRLLPDPSKPAHRARYRARLAGPIRIGRTRLR